MKNMRRIHEERGAGYRFRKKKVLTLGRLQTEHSFGFVAGLLYTHMENE
jgi:hypothetical protein